MGADVITDKFSDIKVYGKSFTGHHKEQIEFTTRGILANYTNWLHVQGFVSMPHGNDGMPRYWKKAGTAKLYDEDNLYFKYLNDRSKEK